MQHAVDAIAHDQLILERLDVDIRGSALERVIDDQIHEANHRRFGGKILQLFDVTEILLVVARRDVVDDLPHRGFAAAVEPFVDGFEISRRQQFRYDPFLRRGRHRVERESVCGIDHREHHFAIRFHYRNRAHFLQKTR